ncbi:hypothetical protein ACJRO7_001910 [Eucalyptus globulus]|uniref:Uncharacterized protein n=1 Tax=Eucalyptus globulus TaxID=34317 RepID=A0ABD3LTK2_EUCGL
MDEKTDQNRARYRADPISSRGGFYGDLAPKPQSSDARYRADPESCSVDAQQDAKSESLATKPASEADAIPPNSDRDRPARLTSKLDSSDEWPDKKRDFVAAAPESGTDAALPISDLEVLEKNVISKAHPSDARLDPHPEPVMAALTSDREPSELHPDSNRNLCKIRLTSDLDSPDAR